jgi:hypothetical protein
MQKIICLILTLMMTLQLVPMASGANGVASEIAAKPPGTRIELRLKGKQKMLGITGAVSGSGFAFIDANSGEHQIAFDDVASVKRVGGKSHTTRNVLIVVGIGVAAIAIAVGIYAKKCAPLGCNSHAGI